MYDAEVKDSSGTLESILSINVAECYIILVGLWIKNEKKYTYVRVAKLQFGCFNVLTLKSPVIIDI